MAKLQEERIVAGINKNKSKSIYRFKSIFLQCKRIKKTCQEKNDTLQKKNFPAGWGIRNGISVPTKTAEHPQSHLSNLLMRS
jgi:hypothetical protein